MDHVLSTRLRDLRATAERVSEQVIAPRAGEVDRSAAWPRHSMQALADAGLMGLHVPRSLGGEEEGLTGLVAIAEAIGRACPSSGLCYAMHCVGTAVIAAKATAHQREHYLKPIARGQHVTSLALAERGTGSHFYLPRTALRRQEAAFVADGTKQFVTNGGFADSYVVSMVSGGSEVEAGAFTCMIVDADTPGASWLEPWQGLGMRGNASRGLQLDGARLPLENLLGREGDQVWYIFEVVAPYFLTAMSAVYLGVARAALDLTFEHLSRRRFAHSGDTLAETPALQDQFAEMWTALEKSRLLVYEAARRGDAGDAEAFPTLCASKADVAETAVAITNQAMTVCGGIAYGENARLAQLLRDARASHVMAPTTHVLKGWVARSLLGLPLL